MNFLKIFQSENKSNNESENPPDCDAQKENEASSPPVTNDVGLNCSQGVKAEEGRTNTSPPFENYEGINVGSHVDNSVRQESFENGANGSMTQPADTGGRLPHGVTEVGETGPSASAIHPMGVNLVGVSPVDMSSSQFDGPSIHEQEKNYGYQNNESLGAGMPYTHMEKIKADGPYPCNNYDMSANDTYGGGNHGRRTHDNSSLNSSMDNSRAHSIQYVTNQEGVHKVDYLHTVEKNMNNIANQKYCVNSREGEKTFQSPTDLHVNNAKVNVSSFEGKTGSNYIDKKNNYPEQISRDGFYNKHQVLGDSYAVSDSVEPVPYGYDKHVNSNNATNGTTSNSEGVNNIVHYPFPSEAFPSGKVTEHNLSNNVMHSFQHQLNDKAFTQNTNVAAGKKVDIPTNQSYMHLYSSVGGEKKMEETREINNYNYGGDLLNKSLRGVKSGIQVGTIEQMDRATKLIQGGHMVSTPQVDNLTNGHLRMGKTEQKRKEQVGEPKQCVGGKEGHNKGIDTVGKMVRWKENEEEVHHKGTNVDTTVEVEDDKGNEYYYEKTLDFLKKEFSIDHSQSGNNSLNDRDILEKTAFFKLINFEKKLATERKRVLNYYHEDKKQIYSSTINKDKQFSHIFLNNEKYYDAKEILAYLLPYHTFYLDDICIDSSEDDEEFSENLESDVREIDAGISQVKDSFRAYTNPSMLWSFNKIIDRTDNQHKRKKVAD
ncbi:conserved Plasmodium protein, unknown function [Plasmodium knowlesi strain H]|uniref:Uncharacterized protein n=3 Tax=Plasmodium knowlesi TaxID=5850 RepID=A0A5K1V1S4_PLAKH|nr:conserved Plasmodium protein, unknown function [Plasmodium knowlesi strain H]OTN65873.1 Uncharacterized protein PKNOH_S100065200 [Plasmodium knowlesi]CAA9988004.1 conserved Plasmodium protein, unknown function [Plasmodium knowlesi strain H]SBO22049.1 conserved Plasmodium protein, unknown function [Plasmodium knowlesi strain H]SBO29139.1 conserved Plasmodium protein, unknown function [Plasmodium knowlesi strain H]VVS77478.1 conserved Plasmodium protein, unknown function [Plasmodium knowlesi |eukprot:XP_002258983.1 hypothetical protein, conserved in Plasmodium species [Plasmodium knowlesi strain H]